MSIRRYGSVVQGVSRQVTSLTMLTWQISGALSVRDPGEKIQWELGAVRELMTLLTSHVGKYVLESLITPLVMFFHDCSQ